MDSIRNLHKLRVNNNFKSKYEFQMRYLVPGSSRTAFHLQTVCEDGSFIRMNNEFVGPLLPARNDRLEEVAKFPHPLHMIKLFA